MSIFPKKKGKKEKEKKGYWIAHVTVTIPEQYALYAAATKAAFEKFGAVVLARGGRACACACVWMWMWICMHADTS